MRHGARRVYFTAACNLPIGPMTELTIEKQFVITNHHDKMFRTGMFAASKVSFGSTTIIFGF